MTPSDAVIARAQMVDGVSRILARFPAVSTPGGALELRILLQGDLFTWRKDLLEAAFSASKALPGEVTLDSSLIPCECGLYMFGSTLEMDGCAVPTAGIGWSLAGRDLSVVTYMPTAGTTWARSGPLAGYGVFRLRVGSSPLSAPFIDQRQFQSSGEFDVRVGGDAVVRFLMASWLWLSQKVMTVQASEPSRQASKLIKRVTAPSSVRVVLLRRAERSESSAEHGDREYHCQWLVRGHWRNQFYSATGVHRPRWIEPYVKGPEDMPFRAPALEVFSVSR